MYFRESDLSDEPDAIIYLIPSETRTRSYYHGGEYEFRFAVESLEVIWDIKTC